MKRLQGTILRGSQLTRDEHDDWSKLAGMSVHNRTSLILRMGDIHPFEPNPRIYSSTVVMDRCNENFVFYWLSRQQKVFPELQTLYLRSHPADRDIVHMLNSAPFKTYLSSDYKLYYDRWLKFERRSGQISIMADDEIRSLSHWFIEEPLDQSRWYDIDKEGDKENKNGNGKD